jgi:two-component system, NarL family, nitrate/nitrite response regulator NarL
VLTQVRLYAEALAGLLSLGQCRVVGTASLPDLRLRVVRAVEPDLVLVDAGLRDVIPVLTRTATAPVVVIGVGESDGDVLSCAEAGATGFVFRDAALPDLLATMESVTSGEMPCSPRIAASLIQRVATLAAEHSTGSPADLTPREVEIVKLVDAGLSNKEIGRRLSIELSTVKNHVHSILEKLGAHRRGEAAARFRQLSA